jgi:hypothetical protein
MKVTLLEAEAIFRPSLASHCSGVTETAHLAHPTHALEALQVWSKSVSNETHFTYDAEVIFHPYLASHSSWVTETLHLHSVHKQFKFGGNRSVMKGTRRGGRQAGRVAVVWAGRQAGKQALSGWELYEVTFLGPNPYKIFAIWFIPC